MQTDIVTKKRSAGRPREFDHDTALHAAMRVFWQKGYEGASLADLTEAMGISKPTLYASFGDKETLLREAVRTYLGLHAEAYAVALNHPTSRQVAEAWLRLTGGVRDEIGEPSGCLLVQGALVGSTSSLLIQGELAALRNEGEKMLEERFERAKKEDDLPGSWEPRPLAQYLSALAYGMAIQSSGGATSTVLNGVVDQVLANWPSMKLGVGSGGFSAADRLRGPSRTA